MILSVGDLQNGDFRARGANSEPPYFAVFGKPIAHSLSPVMQNAALAEIAKTDDDFRGSKYFAFEVAPENLADALDALYEKNFCGINLTIPHKEVVMKIIRDFDPPAAKTGACNTLLKIPRGWKGFNTDGFGLITAIETSLGRKVVGANVVIIGAGGAARAAAFALSAHGCASLALVNRSAERLEKLAADLRGAGYGCTTHRLGEVFDSPDAPVIVNATSLGLKEGDGACVDFSMFPTDGVFFDMPYAKGRITASVAAARERGMRACDGLPMLAWQGAKSLSIWTGKPLLGELMLQTLRDAQ